MKRTQRPGSGPAVFLLAALLLILPAACSSGDTPPVDPGVAADDAERAAEREQKAQRLFSEAQAATPENKVRLYKRIIAIFPETSVVPRAYNRLVFYLLHRTLRNPEEALRYARQYTEKHPDRHEVGEAWFILYRFEALRGDPERARTVAGDWSAWAEAWIERRGDAAPDERLGVLSGLGRLRIWEKRYPEAAEILGRGAAIEGVKDRVLRKQALWDRAVCLGLDAARKEEALAAFDEVLELTRDGVRGHTEEEILAMKRELEEKGKLTPPAPSSDSTGG